MKIIDCARITENPHPKYKEVEVTLTITDGGSYTWKLSPVINRSHCGHRYINELPEEMNTRKSMVRIVALEAVLSKRMGDTLPQGINLELKLNNEPVQLGQKISHDHAYLLLKTIKEGTVQQ